MTYRVLLKKNASKQFASLSEKDQKRVLASLNELRVHPYAGKKLHGDLQGLWSIRVWPYRIIYTVEKKIVTVTVVSIGDRKNIYKKLKSYCSKCG
ncbi:hypothetical protein A3D11_03945 [Candidatus Peribacteria bacterium RIFCSPHIGHO2_02_FULL_49_16]|nr:MAG: hypothetical protein A2880_03180 [Candidatus Peribacteria bacterium RIFCSPHIGHO2_01_FULL_49_38]OGJ59154.1 MAG: hypothetical protein A3D11_03945 [Candidatus Peribacteria bacterium RIFCSPHIGHO2_02_FULL_49_16]